MNQLLKQLTSIPSPSGDEQVISDFVKTYIDKEKRNWKVQPTIYDGADFQHCIVLVFGKPRAAIYAHLDNIGFTARYNNQLVKIGGPRLINGYKLVGEDSIGKIDGALVVDDDNNLSIEFNRVIETGTNLSFKQNYREDDEYIQSCYLDNRLGVFAALKVAEALENGVIVFSCWEEHGGGSVPYIAKFLWERYQIRQCLIADITWITEGVHPGKGVVVSLRDSGLPRKVYTDKIRKILTSKNIAFQVEVEGTGGSDGNELQKQPYPIDWCFVGAAEDHVHTPDEKVHKKDIESMIEAYTVLMQDL